MTIRNRRTKKAYARLFDNPALLSVGGPADLGARVTLFPNGAREMWIQGADGAHGLRLTVSHGPHGLGIQIGRFSGTAKISVNALDVDGRTVDVDATDLEICQYDATARAQAYKRWYRHQETPDDIALLGPDYQR